MRGTERREEILRILSKADGPQSASSLAERFHVSRQVIVGDVALLRASGHEIASTPWGYQLPKTDEALTCTICCCHSLEGMERELQLIIDQGCGVLDVLVEHPVYGVLTGQLSLASRYDLSEFMNTVAQYGAKPLSDLTDGIHYHTIKCPTPEAKERVLTLLRQEGILFES